MKTFQEFILEAKIDWWDGGRGKAKKRESQLTRQRGGTPQQQASRMKQLEKLKQAISNVDSRESDTRPQKTPRQRRQQNAVQNTGYAQTGVRGGNRNPASSVGTVSGVRRRTVTNMRTGQNLGPAEPADTRTSGRYGYVTGGRGTGKSRSGGDIGR
jgi:hypothetical protein